MAENEQPLLAVTDLKVTYGQLTGLKRLDLEVSPGQIQVILGANGAGKSSALRAIAGAVRASGGHIAFDGRDITKLKAWQVAQLGLVLVPEGRQIVGPLTVLENLQLGAFANRHGRPGPEVLEEVFELFPVLGERRHSAGGLLSGGEQQMLAFGRALMAQPKVMLLDEPSMGLAPIMVDRIFQAVTLIAQRGIAVVMVEQNAGALDLGQHVMVLEQGEVRISGRPEELRDDPKVVQAFLGIEMSEEAG